MAIKLSLRRRFSTSGFFKVNGTEHYPVMYREIQSFVADYMTHKDKSSYQLLDCTFGGGNHSIGLLR